MSAATAAAAPAAPAARNTSDQREPAEAALEQRAEHATATQRDELVGQAVVHERRGRRSATARRRAPTDDAADVDERMPGGQHQRRPASDSAISTIVATGRVSGAIPSISLGPQARELRRGRRCLARGASSSLVALELRRALAHPLAAVRALGHVRARPRTRSSCRRRRGPADSLR